ncbi:MAG: sigma 54-interacting transcriptional regulator [Deltaproteobacteria bacterium]|nr:sigma 54-interacting transcriptional regulator [Deltaproteobacteria bacterium]
MTSAFMIFNRRKGEEEAVPADPVASERLVVVAPAPTAATPALLSALQNAFPGEQARFVPSDALSRSPLMNVLAVVAVGQSPEALTTILEQILTQREARKDGFPVLVLAQPLAKLTTLGKWLYDQAVAQKLAGIRLIGYSAEEEISSQLEGKLAPLHGSNFIRMPLAPEVENSGYKYFYIFSPELQTIVALLGELADNNMMRVYLLGAPGTGKTSLAYYFYLRRAKGNFVTVNLSSENTGDKGSMKSLLCGHVTGAIPGAPSREGALSFARDGVCFLDESHGATGTVMQVLMEVLESGQFLPFGATAKRMLECAVIFASNRSWETLRGMMHLDEHARLGATAVGIPDLVKREGDKLAVLASTLATFQSKCTTWKAPEGISAEAWKLINTCPWKGNTRTLIRVAEMACVRYASTNPTSPTLGAAEIAEGLSFWEPETEHMDDNLYTHY